VIGSELMLFDLDRNVAGTIDLVLRLPDGSCALADLKTLSAKGSRYDTRPQLGAGIVMAEQHYGLEFSRGLTIWSKPGQCRIQSHTAQECRQSWTGTFAAYEQRWRPF
jgi:hypothetical protein